MDSEHFNENIERAELFITAYETKDTVAFYPYMKQETLVHFNWLHRRSLLTQENNPLYKRGSQTFVGYLVSRLFLAELRDREIEPILPSSVQFNVYDEYVSTAALNLDRELYTPSVMTGFNSLHRLNETYSLDILLLLIVIVLFGGGFALEKENGNQLVTLFTQPLNRWQITRDKFVSAVTISLSFLAIIFLVIFGFGVLKGGLGHWDYPILHYDKIILDPMIVSDFIGHHYFMSLGQYWINILLIVVFATFFVISVSQLFSNFIKNRIYLLFTTVFICGAGYFFSLQGYFGNLSAFLPTTYLSAGKIADGSMKILANSEYVSVLVGLGVLLTWTLLFMILNIEISERKEVL